MITCRHCGFAAPAGTASCPRCGQPFAQAAPPHPTLLIRLEAAGLPSGEWEVTDRPMGIGRLEDSDIPVPHKSVSRQHARILPTASGFDIEDLGSTNGTWLNDRQITDRTPLSNGDDLSIGDVPLRVSLRAGVAAAQPIIIAASPVDDGTRVAEPRTPPPPPPPLPLPAPPVTPAQSGSGPATVFYDIDDALAAAHPNETATAWDVTPATNVPPPPGVVVEHATLIAAEPVTEPPPPPVPTHDPRPTPAYDPRPTPQADPRPASTFDPRPAPPTNARPPTTMEPRPAPPTNARPPTTMEPRPSPSPVPVAAAGDLSGVALIDLADRLATAVRLLKGDTALALWLFDHAGGQAAAQAFVQQVERAEANPDNPIEQARLLEMAPVASRLLQAAVMLTNVVSTLRSPDDEAQADAPNLDPVRRP